MASDKDDGSVFMEEQTEEDAINLETKMNTDAIISESQMKSQVSEDVESISKQDLKEETTSVEAASDVCVSSPLNPVSKIGTFTSETETILTDEKEDLSGIVKDVVEEGSLADNESDMDVVVNKDARIYLNPDGTLVFNPPGTNESIPIILETGSSSRDHIPVTDTTTVNPNYLVVVENLDGSEVVSSSVHENVVFNSDRSIPTTVASLLPETHRDISHISEDGTSFSPQTITMIFDNSSQLGPESVVVEPNSFIAYNSETVLGSDQLTLETLPVVNEKCESETVSSQGMYDMNQSSFIDVSSLNVVNSADTPCSTTVHHKPNTQATQTIVDDKVWASMQEESKKSVLSDLGNASNDALKILKKLPAVNDILLDVPEKEEDSTGATHNEPSIAKREKQKADLRLLEQFHLEHHMKQVQMKQCSDSVSDIKKDNREMEVDEEDGIDEKALSKEFARALKQAGITDDIPIFSSIKAEVNTKLLSHIPGCQQFLVDKFQDGNHPDCALVFKSDTDCTVEGNLEYIVKIFNAVKQLMQLKSKTQLDFRVDRGGNTKLDKGVNCNLLKPFVSSRGRQPRCSQKVAEMGFVSDLDIFSKDFGLDQNESEVKRTSSKAKTSGQKSKRKRGRPRRVFQSSDKKYKTLPSTEITENPAIPEDHGTSTRDENFVLKSACDGDVTNATEEGERSAFDERVLETADDACIKKLNRDQSRMCLPETDELCSQENEQRNQESSDANNKRAKETSLRLEDSSQMDPVQQRLLEEQIKYKQIMDNKLKHAVTAYSITCTEALESNASLTQEMETSDTVTTVVTENPPENEPFPNVIRRKRGRPRKQGDTNLFVEKVQPRNPLTESAATKQQRNYEENVSFKFFCTSCSFKSKRQSHFLAHLQCHKDSEKKYTCGHCGFVTISLPMFKRHELKHKKNLFRCDLCEAYTTDRKELLTRHIRMKHTIDQKEPRQDKLNCDHCQFSCYNSQKMMRHKVVHERLSQVAENNPFNCPDCMKNFKSRMHLQRHVRDVHGPDVRPHLCDKCGKAFKRTDALQQHKLVHISRTARSLPFKCRFCEKGFRSPAHLKEHMSMHSSERPFLCQYCGAAFKTQPVQKKHILTLHIKPRTHVCSVCCRQFNTKHALQRHENTHAKFETPPNAIFIIERNNATDEKEGEQKASPLTNQDSQPTNLTVGEGAALAVDGQLTNCLVQDMIGTAAAASAIEEPLEQSGSTLQQAYIQGRQNGTTLFYFTGELHQL